MIMSIKTKLVHPQPHQQIFISSQIIFIAIFTRAYILQGLTTLEEVNFSFTRKISHEMSLHLICESSPCWTVPILWSTIAEEYPPLLDHCDLWVLITNKAWLELSSICHLLSDPASYQNTPKTYKNLMDKNYKASSVLFHNSSIKIVNGFIVCL